MAGGGDIRIVGANKRVGSGIANVSDNAVHVKVVSGGGGGGGNVTIVAPLPLPISFDAQTVDCEVVQPTHDDLNANANIQVGDVDVSNANPVPISDAGGSITVDGTVAVTQPVSVDDNGGSLTVDDGGGSLTVDGTVAVTQGGAFAVTIQEPLSVDDNGGSLTVDDGGSSLTVDQATHDNLNANANVQFSDVDVTPANPLPVLITDGTTPADVLSTAALATGPKKSSITNILATTTFDNVTTTANSSTFDATEYRHLNVYLEMAISGGTGGSTIRFFAQFSNDGGTTWFNYAVDQWVDLRYVVAQFDLNEVIPLNYYVGSLFRIQVVATGTTAANTTDVTVDVQGIS